MLLFWCEEQRELHFLVYVNIYHKRPVLVKEGVGELPGATQDSVSVQVGTQKRASRDQLLTGL